MAISEAQSLKPAVTVGVGRKASGQGRRSVMEREKRFQCPLCGARLDSAIQESGCGGFPEWHEEGFAHVTVQVSVSEEAEEED